MIVGSCPLGKGDKDQVPQELGQLNHRFLLRDAGKPRQDLSCKVGCPCPSGEQRQRERQPAREAALGQQDAEKCAQQDDCL